MQGNVRHDPCLQGACDLWAQTACAQKVMLEGEFSLVSYKYDLQMLQESGGV